MEEQVQQTSAGQGNGVFSYVLSFISIVLALLFKGWATIIPAAMAIIFAVYSVRSARRGYGPVKLTIGALIVAIVALSFSTYAYLNKIKIKDIITSEEVVEEEAEEAEEEMEEMVEEAPAVEENEEVEEEMKDIKDTALTDEEKAEKLNEAASNALDELNDELED